MLHKRTFKGLEYPYFINDVSVNEHGNVYHFDISNSLKYIRKLKLIKKSV